MAKNLIPQIAEMLGLRLGEEFQLKRVGNGRDIKGEFYFNENKLWFEDEAGEIYIGDTFLSSVLCGELEIVKLPWKPKKGEGYYTFDTSAGKWMIWQQCWTDHPVDLALFDKKWIFRTKEEAEAALPKVAKEMGVEYEL